METTAFTPSRDDGRSDRQVVIDLVRQLRPGDELSHDRLERELQKGTDREIGRREVYRAANAATRWLVRNEHLALVTMRGHGYRVSVPDDFHGLTLARRDKASVQLSRGRELLEHAPIEDMSPKIREALVPLQILIGGAYAQLHAHNQRLKSHQTELEKLTARVDKLETIEGEAEDVS